MKRTRVLLGIIAVGILVGGYVAGMSVFKEKIEASLTGMIGKPVKIRSVQGTLSPGLVLRGISLEHAQEGSARFSVSQAALRFSFLSLLKGQVGFDLELIRPLFSVEREADGKLKLPAWIQAVSAGRRPPAIPLVRLRVRNGKFIFMDRTVSPEFPWILKEAALSLKQSGTPGVYLYSLLATVDSPEEKPVGKLSANGSLSFADRMADAKVTAEHGALEYLLPYIRPLLGTAPSRGRCSFVSKVVIRDGMLTSETDFTGRDIVFAMEQPTVLGPSGNRLVELLKDKDGAVHMVFTVTGKIGEQMDWSGLVSGAVREAMRQAMTRTIQKALGDSEQGTVSESVRKGIESLGR